MSPMLSVIAVAFVLLSLYCRLPAKIVIHSRKFVSFIEEHKYELGIRTPGRPDFKLPSDPDEEPFDPHLDRDEAFPSHHSQSLKIFRRLLLSSGLQRLYASFRSTSVRHVHYTCFSTSHSPAVVARLTPQNFLFLLDRKVNIEILRRADEIFSVWGSIKCGVVSGIQNSEVYISKSISICW